MGFRFLIAGETQCNAYAETVFLADYLSKHLPSFCYYTIEKSVGDWKIWLFKINAKNKWHHTESPLVWKELLMKGSKPYYIGGASQFLDYCYSYYYFDSIIASEKYEGLLDNIEQFKKRVALENVIINENKYKTPELNTSPKNTLVVTISGARNLLAMHLISGLLDPEYTRGNKLINKIFLYDEHCPKTFMKYVEKECSYVQTDTPGKVVKYVDKIGMALTSTDILIVLDHEPFVEIRPIGEWLYDNKQKMKNLARMINASGPRSLHIIFPNLGPACYNATILKEHINIAKNNIVVATSDIGMEILPVVAKIAEVPMRNMFCPPVWGFVGINHLVDIRTTVHKYNSFEPYKRFTRVKNSTLNIGSLTPEMRTLYYLMHFDDTLWLKVAEIKKMYSQGLATEARNKVNAVINLINLWLFNPSPDNIVNLGIPCNGSFGLHFNGIFSQPARISNGLWEPANDFLMPMDRQVKLPYLEKMAEFVMQLRPEDLPQITPYQPCGCKRKILQTRTGK